MNRRITIAEMSPHVHTFSFGENKVEKIYNWLYVWIGAKLKTGEIQPNDFLPLKGDLAFHIGVSKGTIQNVYRLLENSGIVQSKQRIGTYVVNQKSKNKAEKLTSKREIACEEIKRFILDNKYKIGDELMPVRQISETIGISNTTVQMAIKSLVQKGILKRQRNNFIISDIKFSVTDFEQETLSEKISKLIEEYINKNLKEGEKLPPNNEFAEKFNVSIKTVYDAVKILSGKGLVRTRRGRYGTVVNDNTHKEYQYEQVELKIRNYIMQNLKVGDKVPSIKKLADNYNVSTKTIKTALDNLMLDGYVISQRGRFGGTFVTNIPEPVKEAYTWIAVNPDYITP